jgi:hypothetical protein
VRLPLHRSGAEGRGPERNARTTDTAGHSRDIGAGVLALAAALTLLLVKVCEQAGRQVADDLLGEWLGAVVGAGLAVVLAVWVHRWFGRRPEMPAVGGDVPRKTWAARRRY